MFWCHFRFQRIGSFCLSSSILYFQIDFKIIFAFPRYEAVDLRDGDKGTYLGNSVNKAVKNINEKISEALVGRDPTQQYEIDQAMKDLDTTEKKVLVHLFFLNSQI